MPGGVRLAVKVQPKSRRPGLQAMVPDIDGLRLRIGVSEAAEDGRANAAICALLARTLGVAAGRVAIVQGATSRTKSVRVDGDPADLAARLAAISETLRGRPT